MWGLHGCVAELVTIASPSNLSLAIRRAEQVEMARQFAYMDGAQQQPRGTGWLGQGQGSRGRFAAAQVDPQSQAIAQQQDTIVLQFNAASMETGSGRGRLSANQCCKCRGFGQWAYYCPSRGGAQGRRGDDAVDADEEDAMLVEEVI